MLEVAVHLTRFVVALECERAQQPPLPGRPCVALQSSTRRAQASQHYSDAWPTRSSDRT